MESSLNAGQVSLVAYDHAIAGHDGILCDPTGGALTKPSTPAEIAFYQSCDGHPRLRKVIPRMLGVLDAHTGPSVAAAGAGTGTGTGTVTETVASSTLLSSQPGDTGEGANGHSERKTGGGHGDGDAALPVLSGDVPAPVISGEPVRIEDMVTQSARTTKTQDTSSSDETTESTTTNTTQAETATTASSAAADKPTTITETQRQDATTETWTPSNGRRIDSNLALVMEDIAYEFERPTIMDIKLGARLWADDAPPAKKVRLDEAAAETTSSSLGFRIAGMKVWLGGKGEQVSVQRSVPTEKGEEEGGGEVDVIEVEGYKKFDRWYGRSFSADNIQEGFETFLTSAKSDTWDGTKIIAQRIAGGIREIEDALNAEESRMYSSSILIVYEGDPEALQKALAEEEKPTNAKETTGSLEAFKNSVAGEVVNTTTQEQEQEQEQAPIEILVSTEQLGGGGGGGGGDGDGDDYDDDDCDDDFSGFDISDDEGKLKALDVRLIDFAHASWTPGLGPDENVLHGVRNSARIFENIATGHSRPLDVKGDVREYASHTPLKRP